MLYLDSYLPQALVLTHDTHAINKFINKSSKVYSSQNHLHGLKNFHHKPLSTTYSTQS